MSLEQQAWELADRCIEAVKAGELPKDLSQEEMRLLLWALIEFDAKFQHELEVTFDDYDEPRTNNRNGCKSDVPISRMGIFKSCMGTVSRHRPPHNEQREKRLSADDQRRNGADSLLLSSELFGGDCELESPPPF